MFSKVSRSIDAVWKFITRGGPEKPVKGTKLSLSGTIEDVKELKDIQKKSLDGSPYMQGLYNGLELAVATIEDKDPVYAVKVKQALHGTKSVFKWLHIQVEEEEGIYIPYDVQVELKLSYDPSYGADLDGLRGEPRVFIEDYEIIEARDINEKEVIATSAIKKAVENKLEDLDLTDLWFAESKKKGQAAPGYMAPGTTQTVPATQPGTTVPVKNITPTVPRPTTPCPAGQDWVYDQQAGSWSCQTKTTAAHEEDIHSILEPLLPEVEKQINLKVPLLDIKQFLVLEIGKHKVEDEDKRLLIRNIQRQISPTFLLSYLYNAILKYTGHEVLKVSRQTKEEGKIIELQELIKDKYGLDIPDTLAEQLHDFTEANVFESDKDYFEDIEDFLRKERYKIKRKFRHTSQIRTSDLDEVLKNGRLCPECGIGLTLVEDHPDTGMDEMVYECLECGYSEPKNALEVFDWVLDTFEPKEICERIEVPFDEDINLVDYEEKISQVFLPSYKEQTRSSNFDDLFTDNKVLDTGEIEEARKLSNKVAKEVPDAEYRSERYEEVQESYNPEEDPAAEEKRDLTATKLDGEGYEVKTGEFTDEGKIILYWVAGRREKVAAGKLSNRKGQTQAQMEKTVPVAATPVTPEKATEVLKPGEIPVVMEDEETETLETSKDKTLEEEKIEKKVDLSREEKVRKDVDNLRETVVDLADSVYSIKLSDQQVTELTTKIMTFLSDKISEVTLTRVQDIVGDLLERKGRLSNRRAQKGFVVNELIPGAGQKIDALGTSYIVSAIGKDYVLGVDSHGSEVPILIKDIEYVYRTQALEDSMYYRGSLSNRKSQKIMTGRIESSGIIRGDDRKQYEYDPMDYRHDAGTRVQFVPISGEDSVDVWAIEDSVEGY